MVPPPCRALFSGIGYVDVRAVCIMYPRLSRLPITSGCNFHPRLCLEFPPGRERRELPSTTTTTRENAYYLLTLPRLTLSPRADRHRVRGARAHDTVKCMPSAGAMGIALVCFLPLLGDEDVNVYRFTSVPSTTLASNIARYCPKQLRGPWMNGRNLNPGA